MRSNTPERHKRSGERGEDSTCLMSVFAELHADYDPPGRMRSRFHLNVTRIRTENLSASKLLICAFEAGMKIVERDPASNDGSRSWNSRMWTAFLPDPSYVDRL